MKTSSSSTNFNYGYPTPGPQNPTGQKVMDHVFFVSKTEWKKIREEMHFDFIVVGTGFCALAFIDKVLKNNPHTRILVLERGEFFLPEHFQNLPLPYKSTLGGLSETFPWTLTSRTINGEYIQWQHGMVPFFGGRSTLWSAWCPRPTPEEMIDWPQEVIDTAYKYFPHAEELLNVIPADQIDKVGDEYKTGVRPIYGILQHGLQDLINARLKDVAALTRAIPAPLAVDAPQMANIDFSKFSTPAQLLELVERQKDLAKANKGAAVKIASRCVVEKILEQDGKATALLTSRGVVNVGESKLILAMGTLPPTTLIRNSFPAVKKAGARFTAHFITAVVARVPRADYEFGSQLADLELGAFYIAGYDPSKKQEAQFHIQLTALSDKNPEKNVYNALSHMPDVVATASMQQLITSKDHVVFVCAVLGELDHKNPDNWFMGDNNPDITVNSILQVAPNEQDMKLWDCMDEATFETVEKLLSPKGAGSVEYWDNNTNGWVAQRPSTAEIRVPGLVHEGSTMWIGNEDDAVVGLDYRPYGVENVYITGASLWPASGSWNPTLTMVALAQHLGDNLAPKP